MRRPGLAGRLLATQLLVLLVGAATLTAVALLVAPPVFTRHLARVGETEPEVRRHAEEAFAVAFGVSLLAGAMVAFAAAAVTSWLLVRRVTVPVAQLARAADAVANGRYDVTIARSGLGPEFDGLERAFAGMARRLDRTEHVRSRLLADLAHELRTPVATLEAYVQGLEDGVLPATATSWQVMQDQLERLRRLAGDVAEVSAADEDALVLDLTPVDVSEVAATAVAAALPRFTERGVRLAPELATGLPRALLDRYRLEQVLANLLDNALRHTPAGGTVTVTTGSAGPRQVRLVVADTGEGIPADQLEAVFERLYRVDPARPRGDGGAGLGLTIVRGLVHAHQGTVTADSAGPGRGARFEVVLPVRARPADAPSAGRDPWGSAAVVGP